MESIVKKNLLLVTLFVGIWTTSAHAKTSDLEGRWNTALLRSYDVTETFEFNDEQLSIVANFMWARCEDGGVSAGGHPTYRGGSREAYRIARTILRFLNSDKKAGESDVTMDDILIPCT